MYILIFVFLIMHVTVDSLMEAIKKDPTVLKEEAAVVKDDVADGQRIDAQAIAETSDNKAHDSENKPVQADAQIEELQHKKQLPNQAAAIKRIQQLLSLLPGKSKDVSDDDESSKSGIQQLLSLLPGKSKDVSDDDESRKSGIQQLLSLLPGKSKDVSDDDESRKSGIQQLLSLLPGKSKDVSDDNESRESEVLSWMRNAYESRPEVLSLFFAITRGELEIVRTLVTDNSSEILNYKSPGRRSALLIAAQNGHANIVQYLIDDCEMDINDTDEEGGSALHFAAHDGYTDVMNELFRHQELKKNYADKNGRLPIHYAAQNGHFKAVQLLVINGQDYKAGDKKGSTPLHLAAYCGHLSILDYLMKQEGVVADVLDIHGRTPLHCACQEGSMQVVEALILTYSANAKLQDYEKGITPLHLAAGTGRLDIVKFLCDENRCVIEAVDKIGQTPLHDACSNGHPEVAKYLILEKNCDQNKKDKMGLTPIAIATLMGHKKVLQSLTTQTSHNDSSVAASVIHTSNIPTPIKAESLQGVPKVKLIDTTIEKDSIAQDGTDCCVFKGTYRKTPAAFKLFSSQTAAEKEARLIALAHHENIIKLIGICCSRGPSAYIVTELADQSLFDYLHLHKSIPAITKQLNWAIQITEGLEHLHNLKPECIIHGDIKSPNVLLFLEAGRLKLCDFGSSKKINKSARTKVNGTYKWQAPEVFTEEPSSIASDIYSLGVVLWELFTQQEPYKGIKDFEVGNLVVKGTLLETNRIEFQRGKKLLQDCWMMDQKKRPRVDEVRIELESIYQAGPEVKKDDFMNEVAAVIPVKWRSFGIQLNIQTGKLDDIGSKYENQDAFGKIYDLWESTMAKPVTWKTVTDILKETSLSELSLSKNLSDKHKW